MQGNHAQDQAYDSCTSTAIPHLAFEPGYFCQGSPTGSVPPYLLVEATALLTQYGTQGGDQVEAGWTGLADSG